MSQQILDVDWQLADPNSGGMIDVRGQSSSDTSVADRTNAPRPEFFEHRFQAGRPFMCQDDMTRIMRGGPAIGVITGDFAAWSYEPKFAGFGRCRSSRIAATIDVLR